MKVEIQQLVVQGDECEHLGNVCIDASILSEEVFIAYYLWVLG